MIPVSYYLALSAVLFVHWDSGRAAAPQRAGHVYVAGADVQRRQPGFCHLCAHVRRADRAAGRVLCDDGRGREVAIGLALMVEIFRTKAQH